jgi:beta-lactamase class A
MMALLKRDLQETNQVTGFLGEGLPADSQIWSKAGWTGQVRHDAAYIEVPSLSPFLLVVFTEGREISQNLQILPFVCQSFVQELKAIH